MINFLNIHPTSMYNGGSHFGMFFDNLSCTAFSRLMNVCHLFRLGDFVFGISYWILFSFCRFCLHYFLLYFYLLLQEKPVVLSSLFNLFEGCNVNIYGFVYVINKPALILRASWLMCNAVLIYEMHNFAVDLLTIQDFLHLARHQFNVMFLLQVTHVWPRYLNSAAERNMYAIYF